MSKPQTISFATLTMRRHVRRALCAAALAGCVLSGVCWAVWQTQRAEAAASRLPSARQVAAFVVSNANDSGDGSLRKAIQDANAMAGDDTVTFATPFFSTPRTINLLTALPNITSNLTINGPGAHLLTVRRAFNAADFRIFNILGGITNGVAISGMTITGGNVGINDGGGGISSVSPLTLTNVHLTGNTAGSGGGVALAFADGVFSNCTFSDNTAFGSDGGGGIYYRGDLKTLRIRNSTVSGNRSATLGGGISNSAGIDNTILEITNSTIANNSAVSGGGVSNKENTIGQPIVRLGNTIVASNTPDNLARGPVSPNARFETLSFNLSDNFNGVFTPLGTDITTATPRLGPLALNGGTTPTHALLGGSPALNAGSNPLNLTTDQRGVPRVSGTSADIGAVEMQALIVTNTTDSLGAGTLRQAITDANANGPGLDDIIFGIPPFSTSQTINLLTALPNITSNLTINGPGAHPLTVQRAFNATTNFRIFTIPGGVGQVALSGMTISNGNAGNNNNGGGIESASNLTLTNVHFTGNQASNGGGVTLTSADGIFTGCTFSGNAATSSTTIFGSGGGIYWAGPLGHTLRLVNSTVSGNVATASGGGIYNESEGVSSLTVVSSTITNNFAARGGGIFTQGTTVSPVTTVLRNTIIANNTPSNLTTVTIAGGGAGTVMTNGFNLSDNFNGVFTPAATDITTATPRLGPLALNGGTTPTHALLGGSPALNAGNASGLTTDQRGVARVSGASADVGAVEMQALIVTNTTDSLGAGTLRQAITDANANGPGLDDIIFGIPPFNSELTINLLTPLPDITSSVTINGAGANRLTVRRSDSAVEFRTFTIGGGVSNVTFSGLTISNGRASDFGGGIYSESNLTLTNVAVTSNQASRGGGVAIAFADGVFTGCTISGNRATSSGGGVFYQGNGGHTLRVANSTVSGNISGNNGGGIFNFSSNGNSGLAVVNSTVANNSAAGDGGGIMTLTQGGAGATATTTLRNTIIAGSTPNNLATFIVSGGPTTIISLGFNLTSDNSIQFINQPTDFVNTNPLLGPLQDNGGPTLTHALRFGSRALDAGHSSGATTDQRGLPRRVDLATITNERDSDGADIGAVEAQSAPVQVTPTLAINDVSKAEGNSGTTAFDFTVTLSEASTQTVTVAFFAQNGTATAGSDYAATEGQLTFTPGQTSKTVTVLVNGDTTVEPDETFTVNLRNATNATLAKAQGLGTILNDDQPSGLIVQNTGDSGTGSLRQVIADAPAGSVITFAPTVFNVMRTITLASEIQITKSLTINGPGANLLALSGNNVTRVVRVQGSNLNVTLNDLTITGGRVTSSIGGGILSNSGLTMNRCVIANNFATTSGGGVHLQPGATGIFTACTFNGNTSASGGALYLEGTGNDLILALTNCTISGNTGTTTGGALLHAAASGNSLTAITNCTIANNESADGGGIFIRATANGATPRATTRNSIFASNTNTNLRVLSENGGMATISSLGYNLTTGGGSGLLTATGDQINTNPSLGPLQNNGGTTPTHALLFGSPAIDKGHSSGSASDQRGVGRPVDDPLLPNATGGNGADIGAFERSALAVVSSANFKGAPLAQESIVALFGENLTAGTAANSGLPLPLTLVNTGVLVRDAANTSRAASLFFVSPGQINFQIPPGTSIGAATISVVRDGNLVASTNTTISAVEPALFTANANGAGVPAAVLVRVKADGTQLTEPVAQFQGGAFVPAPINLGPVGEQLILVLFGTGIRNRSNLNAVTLTIGKDSQGVDFAGAQGLVGLDQINSQVLPRSLAGVGTVNVQLTVDGKAANVVTLNFQ